MMCNMMQLQKKIGVRRKTGERIESDWKFKQPNKKTIMSNISPHIQMRVKVIDSFKLVIYQRSSEMKPYSKTLDSSSGMFTSLMEIEAYIEECEQSWLDLDNEKVWSKLIYSPQEQPKYETIMKVKSFLSMFK